MYAALARVTEQPVVGAVPSFIAFYRDEFRSVARLAYVLSGNAGAAEELAQDAFAEAYRRWDEIGRLDQPGAWVRRVVANRAVSRYRRLGAELRAVVRLGADRAAPTDLSIEALAVVDAVHRLPTRQAQAIALHYFADLPLAGVAELMECGEETVRTHLKRARHRLGQLLEEPE